MSARTWAKFRSGGRLFGLGSDRHFKGIVDVQAPAQSGEHFKPKLV